MYSYSSISKDRRFLFGIATFWILWFHSYDLDFSAIKELSFLNIGALLECIRLTGNCGVDIFLLLSGIGLYYSFSIDRDVESFYKRRIRRVVPEALIICIIVNLFIFPPRNLLHFLLRITFLDYYLIKLGDIQIFWYISAILLLYLLFPLFYRLIDRLGCLGAAIIIVSSVIITMCAYYFRYDFLSYQWDMLLTRIPVFTTGILIAPLVKKGKKVPTSGVLLICLAGTLYIGLMCVLFNLLPDRFNFARHYLYLPLAVFLVIAFSFIRSHIKADILVRPLEFLGRYSLEMYLIHQTLYYVFMNRISFFADHKLLYAVVCMLASLLLSVILRSFTDRFFDLIHREQGVPRRRKAWSN